MNTESKKEADYVVVASWIRTHASYPEGPFSSKQTQRMDENNKEQVPCWLWKDFLVVGRASSLSG